MSRESSLSPSPDFGGSHGAGLPIVPVPVGLSRDAADIFRMFSSLLNSPKRSADVKERKQFEAVLCNCDTDDFVVLMEKESLWQLIKDGLSQLDLYWDVCGLLLNRVSLEDEGRECAVSRGIVTILGETLTSNGRVARGDKAIERLGSMAYIVSLLAVDAGEYTVRQWVLNLCTAVKESLEKSLVKGNNAMEAYSLLSTFIKLIYTSTGSPLSNVIAESYIDRTPLGVELLLRVAKRGLIDEADISGVPKIISEKSIVVLSKLNADRPSKSICEQWGGLDPIALGAFLIRVMRESKWVQSQDIALTFFARLVLSQRQIPISYLDRPEVSEAIRHILTVKSAALKVTGVAFLSIVPVRFFYSLMTEFESALAVLAKTPGRSLKQMLFETGRGIWSLPPAVPINKAAARVLADKQFAQHAAEVAPAEIPRCLWMFLPHETQMMIATTQSIDHAPEDVDLETIDNEEDERMVKMMAAKKQQQRQAQAATVAPPPPPPHPAPRQTAGPERLPPRPPVVHQSHVPPRDTSYQVQAQAGHSGGPNLNQGGGAMKSLLSAGIAVGLAAYTSQTLNGLNHSASASALPLKDEPVKPMGMPSNFQDNTLQALGPSGGSFKRRRSEDEDDPEDDVALFNATRQQREGGGKVKRSVSAAYSGEGDDAQIYSAPIARAQALPTASVPLVHPNLACSSFGIEDVRELNQLLDVMFLERNTMGAGGATLMKNMAEAAANISMVIYLMTYRLPAVATVGIDEKLSALKTRAYLVYNGVVNSESMDLLLPFSELLSAESGMMRRTLEAQSRAAGVPATATGVNPYDGGRV